MTTDYIQARKKGIIGFDKSSNEYITVDDVIRFADPGVAKEIERLLLDYGDLRIRLCIPESWVQPKKIYSKR